LDLQVEQAEMCHSSEAIYARRWLCRLTSTFGGSFGLFCDAGSLADDLAGHREGAAEGARGRLEGFAITSEALYDSVAVYELATRALWSPMPHLDQWLPEYSARRWGSQVPAVRETWDLLARTLY